MNFLGIGSGLDLSTMLDSLVQVASQPKVQQLGEKEAETRNSISGLGTLSSLLSDFQDASDALKDSTLYNQRATSITQPSSGDVVSVEADTTAVTGSYDIEVKDLAQGTKGYTSQINTDHDADLGVTDTLTFSLPDTSSPDFSISITSDMSLNEIRDAINEADDNFGVSVNVVDGQLVYTSSVTGDAADKELKVDAATDNRFDFEAGVSGTTIQSAQQAEIVIDGITVNSDTNEFDGQVSGLTITALKESAGDVAEVDVTLDTDSVKTKIEEFAEAYNALREGMNTLKGSTDDDGNFTPGKLTGDPIIRNLESVLGNVLTQQVTGAASGVDTLYAVGLDIESDGTLSVDSDRLNDVLSDNFSDLDELFTGTDGLAYTLSDQLDSYLGFTGIIQGKEDSYNDILDDLEKQYEDHARYIEGYQKTLQQQFTALDSTVAQLNATMSYIGPQLAGLANISASSS